MSDNFKQGFLFGNPFKPKDFSYTWRGYRQKCITNVNIPFFFFVLLKSPEPPAIFLYDCDQYPEDFGIGFTLWNYRWTGTRLLGGSLYGHELPFYTSSYPYQQWYYNQYIEMAPDVLFKLLVSEVTDPLIPVIPGQYSWCRTSLYNYRGNAPRILSYIEWKGGSTDWYVNNQYSAINTLTIGSFTTDYITSPWIRFTYNPSTNQTTINYSDVVTEVISGKKYIRPGFGLELGRAGGRVLIDKLAIYDLS